MAEGPAATDDGRDASIRELHDIALNRLSAVSLQVMAAEVEPASAADTLRRIDSLTREAMHSLRTIERMLHSPAAPVPHLRTPTVHLPTHLLARATNALHAGGVELRVHAPQAVDEVDLLTRNSAVLVLTLLTEHLTARAPHGARARLDVDVTAQELTIAVDSPALPDAPSTPSLDGRVVRSVMECVARAGGSLRLDVDPESVGWRIEVALARPALAAPAAGGGVPGPRLA